MPTYIAYFEIKQKNSKLRDSKEIFAMTENIAKKMLFAWARFTLKKFVNLISIEEK